MTLEALRIQVESARKSRERSSRRAETRKSLDPIRTIQPDARELRYENPRAAMAEEDIIAALFYDPTIIEKISKEDLALFTVPLYRKLCALIEDRVNTGGSVSPDAFAQELSAEEASQLSRILAKKPVGETEQALADCLAVLRQEHTKEASLQALIDAKKSSGGV